MISIFLVSGLRTATISFINKTWILVLAPNLIKAGIGCGGARPDHHHQGGSRRVLSLPRVVRPGTARNIRMGLRKRVRAGPRRVLLQSCPDSRDHLGQGEEPRSLVVPSLRLHCRIGPRSLPSGSARAAPLMPPTVPGGRNLQHHQPFRPEGERRETMMERSVSKVRSEESMALSTFSP